MAVLVGEGQCRRAPDANSSTRVQCDPLRHFDLKRVIPPELNSPELNSNVSSSLRCRSPLLPAFPVAIALFCRPLRQTIQRATFVPRCGTNSCHAAQRSKLALSKCPGVQTKPRVYGFLQPRGLVGWLAYGRAVTAAPTLNWRP